MAATNPPSNGNNLPAVRQNAPMQQAQPSALAASANATLANIQAALPVIAQLNEIDPDLALQVLGIVGSQDAKKPLSLNRAIQAAAWEKRTGHTIGKLSYMDERMGVIDGHMGFAKDVADSAGAYTLEWRPLTREETAAVNPPLTEGDLAIACEVTVMDHYAQILRIQAMEMQVHGHILTTYNKPVGYGVVREIERYDSKGNWNDNAHRFDVLPKEQWLKKPVTLGPNFSWDKKVRIRAKKQALAQVPGVKLSAKEIIEDAKAEGLELGLAPELYGRISREQAEYVVEDARRRAEAPVLTDEELRAHLRDSQQRTRPDGFNGYGEEPDTLAMKSAAPQVVEPDNGIIGGGRTPAPEPPPPSSEELFDAIPGHGETEANELEPMQAQLNWLSSYAMSKGTHAARKDREDRARRCLALLFGSDETARDEFMTQAFGASCAAPFTAGMAEAINDFIGPMKAGDQLVPTPQAVDFLKAFKREVMGQAALFEEA
jgi:hypothetical protein